MKIYVTIILALVTLISCKEDYNSTKSDYAYIGGEIINPSSTFVILEKHEKTIDTIALDGRNRFLFKIDDLEEGLYSFWHGHEYQMILLEPKDSVLFRLNTLEFDESLVFTGEGAKKNNYLINEFLENEQEEKYIVKLCQLNPENFQIQLDSLKAIKTKKLKYFKNKYGSTPLFDKIADANINYSYYSSKEVYPFVHYSKNKEAVLESLPDDFYKYRKDINYNDTFFSNYHNYSSFLRRNFSNLSFKKHCDHGAKGYFNRLNLCYNLDRLYLIDSLVTNTAIKEDLLHHFTISYISKSTNQKHIDKVLKSYLDKSNDENNKTLLARYANSLNNLKRDAKLPNIKIVDYSNKEFEINTLIDSPTVISFWSHSYYDHFKESHYKIYELRKKYPEVKFMVINIDNYGYKKTKKSLKGNRFGCENEFLFKNPDSSKEALAVYPMTKAIIIDKNQKIVNSNSNVFAINFEEQLLGLINK